MADIKSILILCKVIDNYGDIGVVYRLAKSLSDLNPSLNITIASSSLEAFSSMAVQIDPSKEIQSFTYKTSKWTVSRWDVNLQQNGIEIPQIILECFQCGRPDWLEKILFEENIDTIYRIFNIEYLTAEEYADDFHLLKSYTRSSNIKKMFFMPGFTAKTAGLIIDESFYKNLKDQSLQKKSPDTLTVTLFSYERDFLKVFTVLNQIQEQQRKTNPSYSVKVMAAAGKSFPYAQKAWEQSGKKVHFESLPFLPQEEWDKLLCNADINFVRGEESLARAALSGKPFIWHAYLQDEDYQLVKVDALLERLKPFIKDESLYNTVAALWDDYNTPDKELSEKQLFAFFEETINGRLNDYFKAFAENLLANGNLAENLLNYLTENC